MANLTDDPTSYLKRDTEVIAIVLCGRVSDAMDMAKMYGVSIQVNMAGGKGIRTITNLADAVTAVATYPATTPWCIVADGLTDKPTRDLLTSWFGKPQTMDKALGVTTEGIAWRPDRFKA